ATVRGGHRPDRVPGAHHRGHDVDLHQADQRVRVLFVDAPVFAGGTGVVDQYGQPPHLAPGLAEQVRDRVRLGHVRAYRHGLPAPGAEGGAHGPGAVGVGGVVDPHAVPVVGEPSGDRGADAAAGAGDDRRTLVRLRCCHLRVPPVAGSRRLTRRTAGTVPAT